MYRDIYKKHPPPPAVARRTGGKHCPACSDLSVDRRSKTSLYMIISIRCMGVVVARMHEAKRHFHPGYCKSRADTKVKLAWLPPRHRNITIPFIAIGFGNLFNRLTYMASVQSQLQKSGSDVSVKLFGINWETLEMIWNFHLGVLLQVDWNGWS